MTRVKLLLVEDDAATQAKMQQALGERYVVALADTRPKAVGVLVDFKPDVFIVDLALGSTSTGAPDEGLRTLQDILRASPGAKVIAIVATGDEARRAVQSGAADYLSRPIDFAELDMVIKRVAYLDVDDASVDGHHATADDLLRPYRIIGYTPGMRDVFTMVSLVSKTDATVLIQGESGTGKELLARAIHDASRCHAGPFVPISCGAIPDGLLEAELFGHEKGAYTGAHIQRKGKLELADSGTVFLDEVAELSVPLQVKLLRFLQEREIERIGGRHRIPIATRIIAATNKDMKREVAAGRLREDLFFRLSVVTIVLPPLRDRGEDVGMLAAEFLRRNCVQYRRKLQFSADALDAIVRYPWPGNIRELENAIHRAVILTRGTTIEASDLGIAPAAPSDRLSLREARNRVERQMVVETLTRTRGNISRAAVELGVSRPTLHDLLHKHQIAGRTIAGRRRDLSGQPAASSSSRSNGAQ